MNNAERTFTIYIPTDICEKYEGNPEFPKYKFVLLIDTEEVLFNMVNFDRKNLIKLLKNYNHIFDLKNYGYREILLDNVFARIVKQSDYKLYQLSIKALKIKDKDYDNKILCAALDTNVRDIYQNVIDVLLRNNYLKEDDSNYDKLFEMIMIMIEYSSNDQIFDIFSSSWSQLENMGSERFIYCTNANLNIDWLLGTIQTNNFKIMKFILNRLSEICRTKFLSNIEICILLAIIENKLEYADELLKFYKSPKKISKTITDAIYTNLSSRSCRNLMDLNCLQYYHNLIANGKVKFPSYTTRYLIHNASFNKYPVIFTYLITAFPLDAIKTYKKDLVEGDKYKKQIEELYGEYLDQ
jgi:hypothetical protein